MLYKNPRLSQRDFRGSTTKSKQDSNGIGDLYPLQILTAGRAVDKREQLVTPGAQDAFTYSSPAASPAARRAASVATSTAEGFAAGMVRVAVSAAV